MCRSFPQGDLDTAPSYKKPQDGYFQYVNVPAVKEYEFGWNRGNPNHYISRYEQNKDHRFRTRVRKTELHNGRKSWKTQKLKDRKSVVKMRKG